MNPSLGFFSLFPESMYSPLSINSIGISTKFCANVKKPQQQKLQTRKCFKFEYKRMLNLNTIMEKKIELIVTVFFHISNYLFSAARKFFHY